MKLRWKVGDIYTGRYRSFQKRHWPQAYWPNGQLAAALTCEDAYVPRHAKMGMHAPLEAYVYSYAEGAVKRRMMVLTTQYATLKEAKEHVTSFLERHPEYHPKPEVKVEPTNN